MIKLVQKNVVFIALQLLIVHCSLICSAPAAPASATDSKQSAPQPNRANANPAPNDVMRLACARATAPINAAVGRIEEQQLAQGELALTDHAHHLIQGAILSRVHQQVDHLHGHVARTESNQQCVIGTQALILGTVMASLLVTAAIRDEISSTPAPVCLSFSTNSKDPMLCFPVSTRGTTVINVDKAVRMQKLYSQVAKEAKKTSFAKQVKALKKQCTNKRAQLKRANRTQTYPKQKAQHSLNNWHI
jgi:hypothetical protein